MTQNIYQQLGLKQVINACGKMTILGVSSVAPEVMQATARAASSFVEIDQLVDKTGELVSRFTGAEDSYVTSCASAGIAIAVAAAALLYVKSHHCVQKGMLNIEDFAHVAQMYNLPLIVDAAAEEDLRAWVVSGADMVVYSGAKAFNAPTSGFITGKKIWIAACKAQHHGIARAMKIGKENMVGLVYALENYHQGQAVITAEQLQPVVEAISAIHGLTADIEQDEAGRAIWRIRIRVNAQELGVDARVVEAQLRGGYIAIYARRYNLHQGVFSLDPRTVAEGEMALIVARLKEIADHAKD
ncbi:hypothetical protein ACXGPL_001722 [Escherichia coli]